MKSIQRILVVQPYGVGDALFMTPVLRALRTLPTVESVDLLLGSRTEPVFQNNPHVDQIYSIDKGYWHARGTNAIVKDLVSLWKNLRGRYDLLLDFSLQREYGFYGACLGIPRRFGLDYQNRSVFLTRRLSLGEGYEGKHAVDFYCEAGKLLGLEIEDRFLEFYLSESDRSEARRLLGEKSISESSRFLAVAPGGGESWGKDASLKRWPVEFFAEALALLENRTEFEGVLVLGSQDERGLGEELKEKTTLPVVNLCGKISLGVSAALLERSALFLANDGGLVHLAHALRVPLVAFYGPADPLVYGPYPSTPEAISVMREALPCRPCYRGFRYNSACPDHECLTALFPEDVFEFLDQRNFWKGLCQ